MTTILLTGMPGCGKEEFLKVALSHGFTVVRMGDVVREHAPANDGSIGEFANAERQKHHPAIWAERTLLRMEGQRTIIDGVRSLDEVDYFQRELGTDLHIVAVHASPETRYQRLVSRARSDAPSSIEEFLERDRRELGWGIGNVIAKAQVMLVNEGSIADFQNKAEKTLSAI